MRRLTPYLLLGVLMLGVGLEVGLRLPEAPGPTGQIIGSEASAPVPLSQPKGQY
jgi:hypothetical protein